VPTHESIVELEHAWVQLIRRAELPAFDEHLRRESGVELSRPAYVVLARLADLGPLQVSELATQLGVDISTMSRTIKHLDQQGFVSRGRGSDQRCVVLEITATGHEVVQRRRAAGQQLLGQILTGWDDADRRELTRLMVRLSDDFAHYADNLRDPQPVS
jgi:DNA-binding MarR family transcriptional regulator